MNVNQHINHLYKTNNKAELIQLKESLVKTLDDYNIFFDEYLELFDDQMNSKVDRSTPVWKAYNDKYDAQEHIKENINMIDYYLGII